MRGYGNTVFDILILGCIPMVVAKKFKLDKNVRSNRYAELLLSFGGGVLMATTFIHLLPEVAEKAETIDAFKDLKFPVAETFTCIGFFLIYLVEECVHLYLHKKHSDPDVAIIRRSVSILRGEIAYHPDPDQPTVVSTEINTISHRSSRDLNGVNNNNSSWRRSISDREMGHSHAHGGDHSHLVGDAKLLASMRGLMVVLALSVHEIMEGLAVGLEGKTKNVWYMFAAVGAHKFIIAFCVGVELLSCNIRNKLIFTYVFTFAFVSPLGIAIGIGVSSEDISDVPSVILQGFATGTLLYVIFFEILKNNERDGNGLNKFIAVLVGFGVMFLSTVLLSDDDLDE
ncbi:hypothetical protein WA026_005298 [Henosepilachna vigintioctopunctata]|uniref:Uncharacterized protein n=1 Tax=Henosepilachna vigintioctopunctata TaxID=420089 RepID=A0AAW1UNJ5_9CUCU